MRSYGEYIAPSPGKTLVLHDDGEVQDIIRAILQADRKAKPFTVQFAWKIRRNSQRASLRTLWRFVRENIEYRRDWPGHEVVKSPARTWEDGYGDCKSMSVFIGSVLQNLGIPYVYRVVFFDPQRPEQGHIYPVATVKGKEIILDAVHTRFDEEVPYWKKTDYNPRAVALAGIPAGVGEVAPFDWRTVAVPVVVSVAAAVITQLVLDSLR